MSLLQRLEMFFLHCKQKFTAEETFDGYYLEKLPIWHGEVDSENIFLQKWYILEADNKMLNCLFSLRYCLVLILFNTCPSSWTVNPAMYA